LPTVTSPATKPVTLSEKVAVTVNAVLVVLAAALVNVTVGRVTSAVRESRVATVLPLPAASLVLPAAMSTVTVPSAAGVTVKE
jgi:hypothetical protein